MNLILTLDYELFGDGRGNIFNHMINPTDKILQICDQEEIKTTIFFEVLEYLKLKEEWGKSNMGYTENPIVAIENQIKTAALNGHDIQLHIHPQWWGAQYKNNKWHLNLQYWKLGDFNAPDCNIFQLIKLCKENLESLIQEVIPDYKCTILRAGGYNILPSTDIFKAMVKLDLKADSSIYPGGSENGKLSNYDFRNISQNNESWWANETDIRKKSNTSNEILEIPIFSLPVVRWKRHISISKLKSLLKRNNSAISSVAKEKIKGQSSIQKIKFMFEKESMTWDICMFSKSLHRSFFNYIEKSLKEQRKSYVLIGHPKSLQNEKTFKGFISIVKSRKTNYHFKTLKQYYESFV